MAAERYTEIERENRILLEKMTNILSKQRAQVGTSHSADPGRTRLQNTLLTNQNSFSQQKDAYGVSSQNQTLVPEQ
jgi:hypothetical protein